MTVNPAVSFSFSALHAAYHENSRTCRTVTLRHACIAAEGGGLFSLQAMGRHWAGDGKYFPQRGKLYLYINAVRLASGRGVIVFPGRRRLFLFLPLPFSLFGAASPREAVGLVRRSQTRYTVRPSYAFIRCHPLFLSGQQRASSPLFEQLRLLLDVILLQALREAGELLSGQSYLRESYGIGIDHRPEPYA